VLNQIEMSLCPLMLKQARAKDINILTSTDVASIHNRMCDDW